MNLKCKGVGSVAMMVALGLATQPLRAQVNEGALAERVSAVGDSPADPGPLAKLSGSTKPADVSAAMKKVADWQLPRLPEKPNHGWTFATLYAGLMEASATLHDDKYAKAVQGISEGLKWEPGTRLTHADDHAIGQAYVAQYRLHKDPAMIAPMEKRFDEIAAVPDDPAKPVWWWCDALFMAPPVWANLGQITGDPKYDAYMDREWHVTDQLLWDKENSLFFRDATYFDKREKNGAKIFWSRGNGWVMGGLVRVLAVLPKSDPSYTFYETRLKEMAAEMVKLRRPDGLWSPGLLDNADYPLPELSGSAFFVYAMTWGINHGELDAKTYKPVVEKAWKSMVTEHLYADGRLGAIQPVGAAPGAYTAGSSYVFGVGAFLMAGAEIEKMSAAK